MNNEAQSAPNSPEALVETSMTNYAKSTMGNDMADAF